MPRRYNTVGLQLYYETVGIEKMLDARNISYASFELASVPGEVRGGCRYHYILKQGLTSPYQACSNPSP